MSVVDDRVARPRPVRELLLIAVLFLAYKLGRLAIAGDLTAAYANATHIWNLERAIGLPSEAALQQAVLGHHGLLRAANLYYAGVHFPATAALLLWTYLRRPALYRWARTTLAALTAAGLAVHMLLPLAPPRLLSLTGMVDTGHAVGPSVYGNPTSDVLANQYAAMPSLHVGWAAVVSIVLIKATRSRWRWLWLLHPLVTLAVVVVTANHYWLDAAVALALLGAIQLVVGRGWPAVARTPYPAVADVLTSQRTEPAGADPGLVSGAGLVSDLSRGSGPGRRNRTDRGEPTPDGGRSASQRSADAPLLTTRGPW